MTEPTCDEDSPREATRFRLKNELSINCKTNKTCVNRKVCYDRVNRKDKPACDFPCELIKLKLEPSVNRKAKPVCDFPREAKQKIKR